MLCQHCRNETSKYVITDDGVNTYVCRECYIRIKLLSKPGEKNHDNRLETDGEKRAEPGNGCSQRDKK